MKLSFSEIKTKLKDIWPMLIHALPTDVEYLLPTLTELKVFIDQYDPVVKRVKNLYECEEYALGFLVDLRRWRAAQIIDTEKAQLNWAVGVVLTIKKGLLGDTVHYQNVAVTSDAGVILIEPQTKLITNMKRVKEVHFVLM